MKFEKHIDVDTSDQTAVDILIASTQLSKQTIKKIMTKGAVWLSRNESTHRIRRFDKSLKVGDCLHIYFDEKVLNQQPDKAILIADEEIYSIWYKPYGMLSQGSKWGDHCTINRWVEKELKPQRSAFIVHRLDRAAQGLIVIAHQKKVAAFFSRLFQQRKIEKKYQAIVQGKFPESISIDDNIENKSALSHARKIDYDDVLDHSLVEINIETGRKHQIRRHLSAAGYPIVGDRLYGNTSDEERDLCLISCYLSFRSPVEESNKIYTLPKHLMLHL